MSRMGLARDAGSSDGDSETDAVLGRMGWTIRFGEYAFMTLTMSGMEHKDVWEDMYRCSRSFTYDVTLVRR